MCSFSQLVFVINTLNFVMHPSLNDWTAKLCLLPIISGTIIDFYFYFLTIVLFLFFKFIYCRLKRSRIACMFFRVYSERRALVNQVSNQKQIKFSIFLNSSDNEKKKTKSAVAFFHADKKRVPFKMLIRHKINDLFVGFIFCIFQESHSFKLRKPSIFTPKAVAKFTPFAGGTQNGKTVSKQI